MQPYSILNSRAVFTQRHLTQLRKRDAVYIGINNAAQPFPEPKCIALVSARALGCVIGKAGDWSQITFHCAQDIAGCDLTGRAGQFVPAPAAAQARFASFRKCTDVYLRCYRNGTPVTRLTVAV